MSEFGGEDNIAMIYATKFFVTSLEWDSQKVAQAIIDIDENENFGSMQFLFFLSMRIKYFVDSLEKLKIINKEVVPAACKFYSTVDFRIRESV